jgi:hypothetical protein
MISPSARARLSLGIVLAGLAVGLLVRGDLFSDASTYVLMTDSLWSDGDLVYGPEDRARADALRSRFVPAGLLLTKHDWGYGYGKSFVYPAIALPFYALLGIRGFFVLNGLLLASLVLLGADILSHRIAWERAVAVAAAVIGFSVTPGYVDWIDPFLACSVLAAAALAAYRREWPGSCAALLVVLAACRPPYFTLAAAPLTLYAIGRRWRSLTRFVAVAVAIGALFIGISRAAGEAWTPYAAQRFYYPTLFPYDDGGPTALEEVGIPADNAVHERRWPGAREVAEMTKVFFVGRFAGVLVYFPGLVACALWSRRWDREKVVWGLVLLAACEGILFAFPHNYFGGSHALGNRLFTLLPIVLVFVDFVAWRPWRVLASAALAALALPMVRSPLLFSYQPGQQMLQAPYRCLPLEWSHVRRMQPPLSYPGMAAFTDNQYAWEGSGLWTLGGASAEFVFIRPPGQHPRIRLTSPLADVRISDGGVPVPWQPGSLDVVLTRPMATTRDRIREGEEEQVYALTVATESAFRPRAAGDSVDNRSLGVFVQPLDRSPPDRSTAVHLNRIHRWWEPPES